MGWAGWVWVGGVGVGWPSRQTWWLPKFRLIYQRGRWLGGAGGFLLVQRVGVLFVGASSFDVSKLAPCCLMSFSVLSAHWRRGEAASPGRRALFLREDHVGCPKVTWTLAPKSPGHWPVSGSEPVAPWDSRRARERWGWGSAGGHETASSTQGCGITSVTRLGFSPFIWGVSLCDARESPPLYRGHVFGKPMECCTASHPQVRYCRRAQTRGERVVTLGSLLKVCICRFTMEQNERWVCLSFMALCFLILNLQDNHHFGCPPKSDRSIEGFLCTIFSWLLIGMSGGRGEASRHVHLWGPSFTVI